MALRAITDEGERVIFEVVLKLGERPVTALIDDFLRARKIERFNTADGLQTVWGTGEKPKGE